MGLTLELSQISKSYNDQQVIRDCSFKFAKGVAYGVAWTLLNPLVNMVVMSIAFSALFRAVAPNYPVYLLVGLVVWGFFAQTTAYAMGTLLWGGGLLKRIYVPPMIFAVACVANGLINLVFSLLPLVAMMVVLGHPLHATWLYLPVSVLLLAVFCLGVSLLGLHLVGLLHRFPRHVPALPAGLVLPHAHHLPLGDRAPPVRLAHGGQPHDPLCRPLPDAPLPGPGSRRVDARHLLRLDGGDAPPRQLGLRPTGT